MVSLAGSGKLPTNDAFTFITFYHLFYACSETYIKMKVEHEALQFVNLTVLYTLCSTMLGEC